MTARVIITALADLDTAEILAGIDGEAGSLVANKYNLRLEHLYERLAFYPESYPARPTLGQHIRVGVVHPYLVIYRHLEGDGTVSIVRVIDGRRKITPELLRGA